MKLSLLSSEGDLIQMRLEGEFSPETFRPPYSDPGILERAAGTGCYAKTIRLNLERVTLITSTGVSWLIKWHTDCKNAGGKLILHSSPPLVAQVLRLLRMHLVLNIEEDQ